MLSELHRYLCQLLSFPNCSTVLGTPPHRYSKTVFYFCQIHLRIKSFTNFPDLLVVPYRYALSLKNLLFLFFHLRRCQEDCSTIHSLKHRWDCIRNYPIIFVGGNFVGNNPTSSWMWRSEQTTRKKVITRVLGLTCAPCMYHIHQQNGPIVVENQHPISIYSCYDRVWLHLSYFRTH